jgi:hypothetical protein
MYERLKKIIDSVMLGYKIVDYVVSAVDNPEINRIGNQFSMSDRESLLN